MPRTSTRIDRRALIKGAVITVVPAGITGLPGVSLADDNSLAKAAIDRISANRPMTQGRVKVQLPELAENGNTVGMTIAVESPMTSADHVKTIHVVSERNPIADVVKFHLTPRAGRAQVSTNIRLASTQTVTAIAEMSDGALWYGTANVIVTLAACVEGG